MGEYREIGCQAFNGAVVAKVNGQKQLGLTFYSGLSFEKHINEKIIKAKQI